MIPEVQPFVYLGPTESEAVTMFMIGDTSVRDPVIDCFLSGMVRVIGAELIDIHPFIRKRIKSELLLNQLSQILDVFAEFDQIPWDFLKRKDFVFW